ncbi:MAG TPA: glycosyl hydrolase family 8, partial [Aggregatilineales bacterium]|nr:glycosyl hydrolase family 8 [Aggregatilineales bacterium]
SMTDPGFVEGTPWQYLWNTAQDFPGLINLLGGNAGFTSKLQSYFSSNLWTVTNEHDLYDPYLFDLVPGQASHTQSQIRQQLNNTFNTTPGGIASGGNDDSGAMSSFFVFSSIGFYPASPASPTYMIGSPIFNTVTINLNPAYYPGGQFTIQAPNNSATNVYIQSVSRNGQPKNNVMLNHADIAQGGTLTLNMGGTASNWGSGSNPTPTNTAVPTATSIGVVTATPLPTFTASPVPTQTPIPSPSKTPQPTTAGTIQPPTNTPVQTINAPTNTPVGTTILPSVFHYPYNGPTSISFNIADVTNQWQAWKATTITAANAGGGARLRVMGGVDTATTVSEGQGYGMLFASIFDDQATLDGLWLYTSGFLDANGLMNWHTGNPGQVLGTGAAPDGDEDMALGMMNACIKVSKGAWPASPIGLNYCALSTNLINAMYNHERGSNNELLPGDSWNMGSFANGIVNLSYFMPGAYTAFGKFTNNTTGWNAVVSRNYQIAQAAQAQSGNCAKLVPDWVNFNGVATTPGFDANYPNWFYDAARFAWRVALDKVWYNTPNAVNSTNAVGSFFANVGIANVKDNFSMSGGDIGTVHNAFAIANDAAPIWAASNLTGVTCGAATGTVRSTPQQAYTELLNAVDTSYYAGAWRLFGMLLMTGNFPNFYEMAPITPIGTPVPPTHTPAVQSATATRTPASATNTPTVKPPTNTPTPTRIPPTATRIPPTPTPLPTLHPTSTPVSSSGGNTHSGISAVKAVFTSSVTYSNIFQVVNVSSNTNYSASVWIKGSCAVELYVKSGDWGSTKLASVHANAGASWQQYTLPTFNSGSNTKITVILQDDYACRAGQVAYLDDVFAGKPAGANLIQNPGFESGLVAWTRNNTAAIFNILQNP